MAIAYYAHRPEVRHWDELWKANELPHLLLVATRDPLSCYLEAHLPTSGLTLEGGCGLGQYVVYLRRRGYGLIGGDFSLSALRIHRQAYPDSPLLGLDLRRMPFATGAFRGHISLGVVEHLQEGPQDMLREFYRTLAPRGTLLLSVPWVNGYRRLAKPLIQRRQARLHAAGADFYQYAFTQSEIRAVLEQAGFRVHKFYPYSPARGLREFPLLRRLRGMVEHRFVQGKTAMPLSAEAGADKVRGARRILYWPAVLWMFAHMILAVAHKPE